MPSGTKLTDGHSTTISFANAPSAEFWEREVTPPGIDAGGKNDTTTMRNTVWRTFAPKKLKTLTEAAFVAGYDPKCYDTIRDQAGINQLITITFPNGGSIAFWGFLNEFKKNALKEGEFPTANASIHPTNQNNSGVETAPVYTPPA